MGYEVVTRSLTKLLSTVGEAGGSGSLRLLHASLILGLVCYMFFILLFVALGQTPLDPLHFIRKLWPWQTDNHWSFKNVGYVLIVFFGLPFVVAWHRFGRVVAAKGVYVPSRLDKIVVDSWLLFQIVGCFYLAGGVGMPTLALGLYGAAWFMIFLWFSWPQRG